jgi:glutaredoxin
MAISGGLGRSWLRRLASGLARGAERCTGLLRRRPRNLPQPKVVLYTRQGCHLCEQALVVLQRHGLDVSLVDIDQDPALRARYDCCVPVVEIEGRVRFRGRVNELLLRRLLRGQRPG